MKTETTLQLLSAMMTCVILLGIMFYKGFKKVVAPEIKSPIVIPYERPADFCSVNDCLLGKD